MWADNQTWVEQNRKAPKQQKQSIARSFWNGSSGEYRNWSRLQNILAKKRPGAFEVNVWSELIDRPLTFPRPSAFHLQEFVG